MLSDGGTVHESTAVRHPIRLVQSGPAGGVQATGRPAGAGDLAVQELGQRPRPTQAPLVLVRRSHLAGHEG